MTIDLDNLGNGNISHQSGGEEVTGLPQYQQRSAAEVYDALQKLIFVLDDSGSMSQRLAGAIEVLSQSLSPADLERVNKRIENAQVRMEADIAATLRSLEEDNEDIDIVGGDDDAFDPTTVEVPHNFRNEIIWKDKHWASLAGKNEASLTAELFKNPGLCEEIDIFLDEANDRPSKVDALKRVVTKEIKERYMKYGTPDIQVIRFEEDFKVFRTVGEEELIDAVNSLSARGWYTLIAPPVRKAVELCNKAPSVVGCHHIILVTDGLSEDTAECLRLATEMKRNNIVLDFIHIADEYDECSEWDGSASLKNLCEQTGGRFYRVASMADFEKVFFESAKRLMLPPAPSE